MERAATGIVRALRHNETLAILIDRPVTDGGVPVEFFGATTQVPAGPARIALRTGAKVIPVALVRVSERDDRIRAFLDFGVEPPCSGDGERDVQDLTQQIMAAHERFIRRYPDQWYMFRRMWPAPAGTVVAGAAATGRA
jgi:KDO2-lipid IV(A) lauroyltransferase